MLEDVVVRCRKTFGPTHEQTFSAMLSLRTALVGVGRRDRALEVSADIVAARRTLPGPPGAQLANDLLAHGQNLHRAKRMAEAEAVFREALDVWMKTSPTHWKAAAVRACLGSSLLGQEKHAEAEPYLIEGFKELTERTDRMPAYAKNYLPRTADDLVKLYTALGKSEEVARWQAERAKYLPRAAKPRPEKP